MEIEVSKYFVVAQEHDLVSGSPWHDKPNNSLHSPNISVQFI